VTTATPTHESWPRQVLAAPLLRGLDARGRADLALAGRIRKVAAGEELYRAGERGQAIYIVGEGALELRAQRRGEEHVRELRRVGAGESCGEEATIGASYRATATASEASLVAEVPAAMLRRALERAGGGEVAERLERRLLRRATAELLSTLSFTGSLGERDLELLLDGAEHHELRRGDVVYRSGEPPAHLWLVADGMVQLQVEDGDRLHVRAYLARGDFFGDEEVLGDRPRATTAVASGGSLLVSIPAAVARTVADRNPELLRRLRRAASEQAREQRVVVAGAAKNATQHAFRDLYRLQVARSLLVIDLDSCVRCGHCAWACESLHGVARIVRRGDKIVTRVGTGADPSPLLLPNSCQHCENPACMPDCPTGAIGRNVHGEVFIREELCTGCGACAKGCPWDNIQIVPRAPGAPQPPSSGTRFDDVAVKCDLCAGWDGPACVKACPTEAIFRINPADDLPEIGTLLRQGTGDAPVRRAGATWPIVAGAAGIGVAWALWGWAQHVRGAWVAWRGAGWAMGVVAAILMVALAAYGVPKRIVRLWMKKRDRSLRKAGSEPWLRSKVRPQLGAHLVLGLLAVGPAVAHGGIAFQPSSGGVLAAAFALTTVLGVAGALAYALLPRRLARLERSASLPEDYGPARRDLHDQLYGTISGKSELVKRLFEKILVPYLRRPLGWLVLLVRGRSLAGEQRALRARIDRILEGRGAERLAGLDDLVRLVVELRAIGAQRFLTLVLRAWLPAHVVVAAITLALLVIHVVEVLS
jgi:Fe-S-cluster-containing dehydrogenase component/CRP-like cAMP-binding protein